MLDWNDAHPYNAVHVVRIPALFELQRLRSIIEHKLEYRGLARLNLDRQKGTYHHGGGPANCEIEVVATGVDRQSTLTVEIERQLNARFTPGEAFNPY